MMKRMSLLVPQKRSRSWVWWMLVYTVVTTLLLWVARFAMSGSDFSSTYALRFLLLSAVLSIVINGFGWLGARWLWLLSTLGLGSGLALMLYYSSRDLTGWEDLASFLAFMEGIIIGFALGVIAEITALIVRRRKRT